MNFGICCSNILPVVTPQSDNDSTIENNQVNIFIGELNIFSSSLRTISQLKLQILVSYQELVKIIRDANRKGSNIESHTSGVSIEQRNFANRLLRLYFYYRV